MALYNLDGVQQTVMAQRKTVDAQHLNDDDYNDYRRAEVARARQEIGVRKSQIPNLLLTLLGCVAILVILLREGMFGNWTTKKWAGKGRCDLYYGEVGNQPCGRMCEQQEAILSDASNIFDEIDDMRRLQVKALRGHDVAELLRLDKELETLFGKEERAFGALRQHRRDHGC